MTQWTRLRRGHEDRSRLTQETLVSQPPAPTSEDDEGLTDDSGHPFIRHNSATSLGSAASSSRHSLDSGLMMHSDRGRLQNMSSQSIVSGAGPLPQFHVSDSSPGLHGLPIYDYFEGASKQHHSSPSIKRPKASSKHYGRSNGNYAGSSTGTWSRRFRRWMPRITLGRRLRSICGCVGRMGSHPCLPNRTSTILMTLVMITIFIAGMTKSIIYIFDTDKEPTPWRSYCATQEPFPHHLVEQIEPVNIFMGIFSVDSAYDRRNLIRNTWLRHSAVDNRPTLRSMVDVYGNRLIHSVAPTVTAKFIIGRPRKNHARRVALEMELFNDIVVLDIKENMNLGKSYRYFQWASENATVPIWKKRDTSSDVTTPDEGPTGDYQLEIVKPDYIAKADDDSFILLDELERHLRLVERTRLYWGYYIREGFMAGELYVLSRDLVDYIATYPPLRSYTRGAEDKRTAKWMRMYPNGTVTYRTEQCRIYDHPKAGTPYSHGFLFEDEIEKIRREAAGIPDEIQRLRRGIAYPDSYTTAGVFRRTYVPPAQGMTIGEEIEALVEGGGRFNGTWYDMDSIPDELEVDKCDPNSRSLPDSPSQSGDLALQKQRSSQPYSSKTTTTIYEDPWADPHLHRRRSGGTIAVHYIKRHEWFLETASALLGRQAWTVPARQYQPTLHRSSNERNHVSDGGVRQRDFVTGGSPWVDENGSGMVWPQRIQPPMTVTEARRNRAQQQCPASQDRSGTHSPSYKHFITVPKLFKQAMDEITAPLSPLDLPSSEEGQQ